MPPIRDRFCSACGSPFGSPQGYPRTCGNPSCGMMVWANPIPVAVALVPVRHGDRLGLLVVRRGVEPALGKLALVGGFVEEHERWQAAAVREVMEETSVAIDEQSLRAFDYVSTEPHPGRVLLFSVSAAVDLAAFAPFIANRESMERGVVFGPDGLDQVFAFPLHAAAARRWFAERAVTGDHDFLSC